MDQELTSHALGGLAGSRWMLLHMQLGSRDFRKLAVSK